MESEALREARCHREEREAAEEASPSDWDLVEEAVEKKDWAVVRWILRQGGIVDVDKRRGPKTKTLLHDACHDGNLETVQMLCQDMGADVGLQSGTRRWAAVHYACDGGHADVIRFLLTEGGADVESPDQHGSHPLHLGAHSLAVVQCLVEEFGADVEAASDVWEKPVHRAARGGDVSCLRYLLGRGARLDAKKEGGEGVLHFAARAESADGLRYLVEECGCDLSAWEEFEKDWLLSAAVLEDSQECLQYLVEECGLSLEGKERSGALFLSLAAQWGAMAVADYLVQQLGASPHEGRPPPLHAAAQHGRLAMVQWLVQQCHVDVEVADFYGRRSVHFAAAGGNLPTLQFLVEEGADVNAEMTGKRTPLHLAAERHKMACVRYLVEEADADVLLENEGGERPSQVAARLGHEPMAAFLQEAEEMAQMQKNPE